MLFLATKFAVIYYKSTRKQIELLSHFFDFKALSLSPLLISCNFFNENISNSISSLSLSITGCQKQGMSSFVFKIPYFYICSRPLSGAFSSFLHGPCQVYSWIFYLVCSYCDGENFPPIISFFHGIYLLVYFFST